jgi:hypothetical protein
MAHSSSTRALSPVVTPCGPVRQVEEVERQHAAEEQRGGDRRQGAVERCLVREVAQHVPHRHQGVCSGDGVVRQREALDALGVRDVFSCQGHHGRRRVGGDHPVTGVDEVPGQLPAAAAELDDGAVPAQHRPQSLQDPGGAGVGVEPEATLVHQRQIGSVQGACWRRHTQIIAGEIRVVDNGVSKQPRWGMTRSRSGARRDIETT